MTQGAECPAVRLNNTMMIQAACGLENTTCYTHHGNILMDREEIKENVIGFEALYNSMEKCRKGVMWKDSTAHYYLNAIEETIKLKDSLESGSYKARKPVHFTVTHPKKREIISISFRDRIYQRSLNDNAIYPQMSNSFIRHNCACQKGKGTDDARRQLTYFMQKFYRAYGREGYILQCDIHGYYPNMRHDVAKKKFKKHLDGWTYGQTEKVLDDQYAGATGYNPGSQMIQIAGISVLDGLDHFIKERLRIRFYIRYMDDFILLHKDRNYLEYCRQEIEKFINNMGFEFNARKTKIHPISRDILFLGFYFRLTETGKVVKIINPDNVKHERKKLRRLVAKARQGEISREKVNECYKGWKNHAEKGNSARLIQRMDRYYKELWEE